MIGSKQHLSQKQALQQRLSPQQIQYIKLLQLPALAMEMRVKEELELNPVLEEVDAEDERISEEERQNRDDSEVKDSYTTDPVDENREIDWESILHDQDNEGFQPLWTPGSDDWTDLPRPYYQNLTEQLEQQVALLPLNDKEKLIADEIIGSIDEDGYFRREIASVVDGITFHKGIRITADEVERVLRRIQQLDPPGIGARDLRECLLVQLEQLDDSSPVTMAARRMLSDAWSDFERKHFNRIMKKVRIDEETLRKVFELVQGLNPKPGMVSEPEDSNDYIVPDFSVWFRPSSDQEDEGEFVIQLNRRNVPRLRISPGYRDMWDNLKTQTASGEETDKTRQFIREKIDSAKWFIDSIRQRYDTLQNVMQTLVELQQDFFKYGSGLKPMILKDIADRVNMDISTISRIVNGKYVQTPFGVFELKYFFTEGVENEEGEDVSNLEIKKILSELIGSEDKRKPHSDQELTDLLRDKGFPLARRTVTKYREQLNIPVARLRKGF
ncbi:MAG: RNA polymerase factor sigma-54 [Cyclonatronaceae bacterium]